MTIRLSNAARTAQATAVGAVIDGGSGAGTLQLRTLVQAASPDAADTGDLLVTFTLPEPVFSAVTNAVATLDADPDISAVATGTGTAGHFRILDSDGNGVVDGSVGTTGADLNFNIVSIVTGGTVTLEAGSITFPV